MKKTIRNIMIVCLLVVAAVMFIPGVLAEFTSNSTGSITVNGLESGVTATAYRLMKVNISNEQPQDPVYVWEDSVATWLNGKEEYKGYVGEGNAVDTSFNKTLDRSAALAKFYDDIADAIKNSEISGLTSYSATAGDDKIATIAEVKMGNYLVLMNNGMRVYKPLSANVIPKANAQGKWDVQSGEVLNSDVTTKSSAPDIKKTVEDAQQAQAAAATAYIGKKVKYTLEVTVPHYPDTTTNKTLFIEDQLSAGLDFVADTTGDYAMVVKSDTGATLVQGTDYSLSYADRKITLHFDGAFYDRVKAYNKITITYYATVNENAIVKAENTATLHYNNDPYGYEDPHPSTPEVTVYTYGFDITKVKKGSTSTVLTGAEFIISKNEDASNPLSFVALDGRPGEYRLAKDGETGTTTLVATNGTLKVYGLDTGKYYVKETKAPAGYVINPVPQPKTLTDSEPNGVLDDQGEDDNLLTFNFENSDSIIDLPVTGGIGTLIFSIIGVLFMGTSIVLVRNILKKKEVQL